MTIAVLGNTPELSALELGVPYTGGQIALTEKPADLKRLGGTVKLADQIGTADRNLKNLDQLFNLLTTVASDHKLVFGFSLYAGDATITEKDLKSCQQKMRGVGLDWKKKLKAEGRSVRFVVSDDVALSSVIVTNEHLLRDQTDFILALYHDQVVLGRTTAVQDFRTFSDRDFGRPQRDSFSGMLPPKVARMMLNIGTDCLYQPVETCHDMSLLDPFCGSGTVIQEALQLGFTKVTGSDISEKCIADTTDNINWLIEQVPTINTEDLNLYQHDVLTLGDILPPHSINVVVGEGYLGPVNLNNLPTITKELTTFYRDTFAVLKELLTPTGRIILAVPSWKQGDGLLELDLDQAIAAAGLKSWHAPIVYGRAAARVVRKILFLK